MTLLPGHALRSLPLSLVVGLAVLSARPARAGDTPAATVEKEGRWRKPHWAWLSAEAGAESVHLWTFHANLDNLTAGFAPSSGFGPAASVGLGGRLSVITIGARARVASFDGDAPDRGGGGWRLWTLDGELGFRVPIQRVEPFFTVAGGYAAIGGLTSAVAGLGRGVEVNGANVRAGAGVDVFLTRYLTVGANVSGEGLFLARPGASIRDLLVARQVNTINEAKARVGDADGASGGWSLALTGGLGLHY